ncbi:hypothetical protein BGX23_007129 [Mortierella sp. AD031]|nr:hypothetical protein BGX23_007129 [Mortierella sp. AD031]
MARSTRQTSHSVPAGTTVPLARHVLSRTIALTIVVLAATLFNNPATAAAAGITYQQVAYSATAVLENRLFVYGGLTDLSSPTSYTSQFLSLSLTDDFDTDKIPWEYHPEGSTSYSSMATAMASGAYSLDYNRFIVTGNRNNIGHASATIYDTDTHTWSPAADPPGDMGTTTAANRMQDYRRDSPGVALDKKNGMLIEFGGHNATAITNEISILDTNQPSDKMTWSFSGYLDSVPTLYAPNLVYLPSQNATLIMGGCDQMGPDGVHPTRCVSFDTLYTLSSESVRSASPKATRVNISGTVFPPPRVFTCAVLHNNSVVMFGGGAPGSASSNSPLQDAWVLHLKNWTWSQVSMPGFPAKGIMGHGCHLANYDQVLVVGAKVGLGLSVVVVLGAIGAGLFLRHRRTKAAALKKQTSNENRNRNNNNNISGSESHGRRRRLKRSQSGHSRADDDGILPRHHQRSEPEPSSPVSLNHAHDIPLEPLADHERTLRGTAEWPLPAGSSGDHSSRSAVAKASHSARSTNGSSSSTIIVEPTSPRLENATALPRLQESEREQQSSRFFTEQQQQQ